MSMVNKYIIISFLPAPIHALCTATIIGFGHYNGYRNENEKDRIQCK